MVKKCPKCWKIAHTGLPTKNETVDNLKLLRYDDLEFEDGNKSVLDCKEPWK